MSVQDAIELVAALSTLWCWYSAIRWLRRNRKYWRLALLAIVWLLSVSLFFFAVNLNMRVGAIPLNYWALGIFIQGVLSLGLYFRFLDDP